MRVLASALRGYVRDSTFKQLQKRLLYTLAGNVAGNGCILALAGDLIKLINIDDAFLRALHIKVGGLQKFKYYVFNVLTDVARLRQRGGVRNGKGYIQHLGHGLREQGLAAAGGADEQNIALLQFNVVF